MCVLDENLISFFFSQICFRRGFEKMLNLPLEHAYHGFSFHSLRTPVHHSPYPGTLTLPTLSSQVSKQQILFLIFKKNFKNF